MLRLILSGFCGLGGPHLARPIDVSGLMRSRDTTQRHRQLTKTVIYRLASSLPEPNRRETVVGALFIHPSLPSNGFPLLRLVEKRRNPDDGITRPTDAAHAHRSNNTRTPLYTSRGKKPFSWFILNNDNLQFQSPIIRVKSSLDLSSPRVD